MAASVVLPTYAPDRPSALQRLWRWLGAVLSVARERRELAMLDDHLLADIGLDRHSAEVESQRAFWDLPANTWPH